MADQRHDCSPPELEGWDHDEDWRCPDCEQWWFVGRLNACYSCRRDDGPTWERFGTGDGSFPLIQVARGGTRFDTGR